MKTSGALKYDYHRSNSGLVVLDDINDVSESLDTFNHFFGGRSNESSSESIICVGGNCRNFDVTFFLRYLTICNLL